MIYPSSSLSWSIKVTVGAIKICADGMGVRVHCLICDRLMFSYIGSAEGLDGGLFV